MPPMSRRNTGWILLAVTLAGLLAAALLPPIPQDPAYHRFADGRRLLGLPNGLNLLSSFAFTLAGLHGLAALARASLPDGAPKLPWAAFFLSVALVGPGSAWYHLSPENQSLFWDRLPMAAAFAALPCALIAERLGPRLGRALVLPGVLLGVGSVLFWILTEGVGRGDLRPYGVVHFLPVLLLPLLLLLRPAPGRDRPWWSALLLFMLATLAEALDRPLFALTGELASGHTLKHLLAALAVVCLARGLRPLKL